jgi:ABC-type antimicrobial peptide transport system permease subunit
VTEILAILLSSIGFFVGAVFGVGLGSVMGMLIIIMKSEKLGVHITVDDEEKMRVVNTMKKLLRDHGVDD